MKVLVITPTYNESKNILLLIEKIKNISTNSDILVVDGDPLKDITVLGDKTKLSHIFLNGKEIKREEEIKDITPPQGWRLSPYSDGILTQELAKK